MISEAEILNKLEKKTLKRKATNRIKKRKKKSNSILNLIKKETDISKLKYF